MKKKFTKPYLVFFADSYMWIAEFNSLKEARQYVQEEHDVIDKYGGHKTEYQIVKVEYK